MSAVVASTMHTATRQQDRNTPAFVRWAGTHGILNTDGMGVKEAVIAAGLNYEVTLDDAAAVSRVTGAQTMMDGFRATMRRDPNGGVVPLGVVKTRYAICQNLDALDFAQSLIDDFGANIVAASAHGNPLGARAYLALKAPQVMHLSGVDPHQMYVVITNSHDGSSGVTCTLHAVRDESGVDVAFDLGAAPQRWVVRHTGDLDMKYREATKTVEMVERWIETYEGMSRLLLGARVREQQVNRFVHAMLPTPTSAGKRSETTWARRRAELHELCITATEGHGFGDRTAMAVFNAACEYIDHHAGTRGGDPDMTRAKRALDGRNTLAKSRAWRLLSDEVQNN